VPQSPVCAKIHQPLDVHGDFSPEITFNLEVLIDYLPDAAYLLIGQVI